MKFVLTKDPENYLKKHRKNQAWTYKQETFKFDSGYFYAPYVPLLSTPVVGSSTTGTVYTTAYTTSHGYVFYDQ